MKTAPDFFRTIHIPTSDATTGDGVWTPVTSAMLAGSWASVRLAWRLMVSLDVEGRPGVQYSQDGVTWDTPKELESTWRNPAFTIQSLTSTSLPPSGVSERVHVRFGFFFRRNNGGSVPLLVQVQHRFEPSAKRARRVTLPEATVATVQSTTPTFLVGSPPVQVADLAAVRGVLDILATTSACQVQLGYRLSPDGVDWGTPTALPGTSARSTVGADYGTFASIAPGADGFVQFGFLTADTGTPTRVNFARVRALIELR